MPNLSVRTAVRCLGIDRLSSLSLQDDIFGVRICGRRITTNSLREQLIFIRDSPGVIHNFTASPDSFTTSGDGREVVLEWRVEKIEFVRILSDVLGIVHYDIPTNTPCGEWGDSISVTVDETQTFTLHAFQAGHRDAEEHGARYTRSATVTVRERPRPEATTVGYGSLWIWNCHTEERTVTIYLLDHSTGSVEDRGSLRAAYDSFGSCAGESMAIELEDSHFYQIIAYDPGSPGCSPRHLTTPGCKRLVTPLIRGDESGPQLPITVG